LRAHFTTLDKPSQAIVTFDLTQHDYDNMHYIAENAQLLNVILKKYSTLSVHYPLFTKEQIYAIPHVFTLDCSFDITAQKVFIDQKKLSLEEQFVLLYIQTIELVQICIDIYNDFERKGTEQPLVFLKNGI